MPPQFDAVIMIEDVHVQNEKFTIRKAAPPWQHLSPAGEDIGESEMALPSPLASIPRLIPVLSQRMVSLM